MIPCYLSNLFWFAWETKIKWWWQNMKMLLKFEQQEAGEQSSKESCRGAISRCSGGTHGGDFQGPNKFQEDQMYKPQQLHIWACHELSMAFITACTVKLNFNSLNNRPRSSSIESVSPHTTSIIHLLCLLSFLSDRLRLQNKEFIRKCNYVASVAKGPGKSRLSKSKDIGLNYYFGKGKSHP